VTIAHILGIPAEESIVQLAPAGAVVVTALALAARTTLDRLRPRRRRRRDEAVDGPGHTLRR